MLESAERQKVHYDRHDVSLSLRATCQKAPSAKRCIKTQHIDLIDVTRLGSQKALSAKRRIKTRGECRRGV